MPENSYRPENADTLATPSSRFLEAHRRPGPTDSAHDARTRKAGAVMAPIAEGTLRYPGSVSIDFQSEFSRRNYACEFVPPVYIPGRPLEIAPFQMPIPAPSTDPRDEVIYGIIPNRPRIMQFPPPNENKHWGEESCAHACYSASSSPSG